MAARPAYFLPWLRMDDDSVRIAVGLRLGVPICGPHSCHHCGAEVDVPGHQRHAALNDIIHRTLTSAHVTSRLEPPGLNRVDGKRPDGVTTVPWKCGKLLMWDATRLLHLTSVRRPRRLGR